MTRLKKLIGKYIYKFLASYKPVIREIVTESSKKERVDRCEIANTAKIYFCNQIQDSSVGDFTYIAHNATISITKIGKFCSIGPNLMCGRGIHPTDGISTAPMFYSTIKQNGMTLSNSDKVTERRPVYIGNDVFIGMNVTILDGVTIGDGAVVGAGAVVSKNIPPYAIALGNPIRVIRYRFSEEIIEKLLRIKWWDWEEKKLREVEKYFNDVETFVKLYS